MMRSRSLGGVLAAALLFSCLPVDTRKPPGALHVSVRGNDALADGIALTSDGWRIDYDRFLVTIGHTFLSNEACDVYSEADYSRIVDARRREPQKLSLLFADGRCGLSFAVTAPDEDSLLTPGVTQRDKDFLREWGAGHDAGISMRVEGRATNGERVKHFGWSYRRYSGYDCSSGVTGLFFDLSHEREESATITLRGEALFELDHELAPGTLRFAPFSEADDVFGDGDGEITTEELEGAPSTDVASGTLRAELDGSLFPAIPALDQERCRALLLNEPPPRAD